MSEFGNNIEINADVPQINIGASAECSYIDTKISEYLQEYMNTLVDNSRREFRDMPSLGEKIDLVCWTWAENPETANAAISLKSLQAIRKLEDTVVLREEDSRKYVMPIFDPFWEKVDRQIYEHFSTYIVDETAKGIMPFEALTPDAHNPICLLDDYVLTRHQGSNGIVTYAANNLGDNATIVTAQA